LPYIDLEYSNDQRLAQEVDLLIEKEMKKRKLPAEPKEYEFKNNSSSSINKYLERISEGEKLDSINVSRLRLLEPSNFDVKEWSESLDNSYVQLEHQNLRMLNLEFLSKFGQNLWLIANFNLESYLKVLNSKLLEVKDEIKLLNRKRKEDQVKGGDKLYILKHKKVDLINNLNKVNIAKKKLHLEVEKLRKDLEKKK
ncbi:hypothetical protein HK099_002355, partial [Clydaea vesicula]